jgi:hypothetical protein
MLLFHEYEATTKPRKWSQAMHAMQGECLFTLWKASENVDSELSVVLRSLLFQGTASIFMTFAELKQESFMEVGYL